MKIGHRGRLHKLQTVLLQNQLRNNRNEWIWNTFHHNRHRLKFFEGQLTQLNGPENVIQNDQFSSIVSLLVAINVLVFENDIKIQFTCL